MKPLFTQIIAYLVVAGCSFTSIFASAAGAEFEADIVILSGSEAGFTAAIQAARMKKTVVLIEPTGHPGGMAAEGISGDIKHGNQVVVTGIAREFYRRTAKHYGRPDPFSRSRWVPSYEPHVAEGIAKKMLSEYSSRITILSGQRIREGDEGIEKTGSRVKAVILQDGTRIAGRVFIDASIEGHLLHFAGVSTVTGRESNSTYNETLNGIQAESHHRNFRVRVDPWIKPGEPASGLIATVQSGGVGKPGSADPHVMGFCFRMCLTRDPENIVKIKKPAGYDPATYEIYRRYFDAGGTLFAPSGRLPGGKTDLGSWHDLSANLYGENVSYPAGTYAEQDRVVAYHRNFTRGLIWFLQNDPSVPERTRASWKGWGLCRNEFTGNDHWPRRLYIRSARRMKSDFVHTEHHTRWPNPKRVNDPVAMAWWPPDMHHARRIVRNGAVYNEGFVYGDGGWSPFGISYRSLVPRRGEATNVITPTCPSSSYVAYGAIRILCTFMMLGQASGAAAAMAVENDIDIQDVPYTVLRKRLLADGLALEIPDGASWDGRRRISYAGESKPGSNQPGAQQLVVGATRCANQFPITALPAMLKSRKAQLWTVPRGVSKQPGAAWKLKLKKPATAYLLVMNRGDFQPKDWELVENAVVVWETPEGKKFEDRVFSRQVKAGELIIPPHTGHDGNGWHGIPNAVVIVNE